MDYSDKSPINQTHTIIRLSGLMHQSTPTVPDYHSFLAWFTSENHRRSFFSKTKSQSIPHRSDRHTAIMPQTKTKKYAYINSLRGIAILLVVIRHVFMWIPPTSAILEAIGSIAGRGVQLFYLVSSITLCFSIANRKKKENYPFRNFFLRRIFRIAPLFYLAIIFYYCIAPWKIEAWKVITSFLFIHGFHPESINGVVPGSWSIAVQMTFYLCLPLLYRFFSNPKKALIGVFVATLLSLLISKGLYTIFLPKLTGELEIVYYEYFFYWFPAQLPIFLMGILVFRIMESPEHNQKRWAWPTMFIACYLMVAFAKCYYIRLLPHHLLLGVAFTFLFYSLSLNPIPLLVNQVLGWIGKLSYSIYLLHFAILSFYVYHFPNGLLLQNLPSILVSLLAVLSTAILFSIITYNLIEKPGIRLGKFLIEKLESSATSTLGTKEV